MSNTIEFSTPQGNIIGKRTNSGAKFLGIPYAQPPVGSLRFRAPKDFEQWGSAPRKATQFASDPIQHKMHKALSEDCLYLNVYVPLSAADRGPLPVVVWLFGGSYVHGGCRGRWMMHGSKGLYDGEAFASENECIVVTINYRVGFFGFLYLSDLDSRLESNLGLKDCECALRWVRRNISSYGGDADNVTLWGQSAGAALACAMMCVPSAKGLFHRVISQSACMESFYTPSEASRITDVYLSKLGLERSESDTAERLLDMRYEDLTSVIESMDEYVRSSKFGICTINPVVDGSYLTEFPSLSKFDELGVDILIGSNHDEALVFGSIMKGISGDECAKRILPNHSEDFRRRVLARFDTPPSVKTYCWLATNVMYAIPKLRLASDIASKRRAYVYTYSYKSWLLRQMGWDACHVAELPLLFGNMRPWFHMPFYIGDSDTASRLGGRMRRYWGNFVHTGDPNKEEWRRDPQDLLTWPQFTAESMRQMTFDVEDKVSDTAAADTLKRFEGETHFFVR